MWLWKGYPIISIVCGLCIHSQRSKVRLDWYGIYPEEYSCIRTGEYPTESSFTTISKWGGSKDKEAEALYKEYQKASASLSAAQKTQREEAIVAKEKEAAELRKKYFGPEGEMAKKQEALIAPIQDKIYEAVKQISEQKGYAAVVDRGSAQSIIFASPSIDISNEVLSRLGYSN